MMSIPWTPDDDHARRLLDERIESYDVEPAARSWWEHILAWLNDALRLNVDPSGAGSIVIQVILVLAVAVLIFLLIRFFRPSVSPATNQAQHQLVDPSVSAAQYLEQAHQLLAHGHRSQAFLHAYRSMVRTGAERDLTEVTPSTTATVFGWALGSVLPAHREAISQASDDFNRISYGGAVPSREATEAVLQLAKTVMTAPPTVTDQNPIRLMPR